MMLCTHWHQSSAQHVQYTHKYMHCGTLALPVPRAHTHSDTDTVTRACTRILKRHADRLGFQVARPPARTHRDARRRTGPHSVTRPPAASGPHTPARPPARGPPARPPSAAGARTHRGRGCRFAPPFTVMRATVPGPGPARRDRAVGQSHRHAGDTLTLTGTPGPTHRHCNTHKHTRTHARSHAHAHTHTHTYTHTHTHTLAL